MNDLIDQLVKLRDDSQKVSRMSVIPLNLQQAAVYLGVSTSTMQNYVRRGLIKKMVSNGLAGYMLSDLNLLMK